MRFAGNKIFVVLASVLVGANAFGAVELGIEALESSGYALLKNKRVGLIADQTGVDSHGVRTRVLLRRNCNLVALYAPEHGLDGTLKAGRHVRYLRACGNQPAVAHQFDYSQYSEETRNVFKCCGSSSVASQFAGGIEPAGIVASWTEDVTQFKGERSQYLLY
jgi:uncharacterized protein YbbC (DUF1343 family)